MLSRVSPVQGLEQNLAVRASSLPLPAGSRTAGVRLGSARLQMLLCVPSPQHPPPPARLAGPGRAAMVAGINVYGLVSDCSCFTRLAGALCHRLLFGVRATHHFVVLLGAVPQTSFQQPPAHFGPPRRCWARLYLLFHPPPNPLLSLRSRKMLAPEEVDLGPAV